MDGVSDGGVRPTPQVFRRPGYIPKVMALIAIKETRGAENPPARHTIPTPPNGDRMHADPAREVRGFVSTQKRDSYAFA